MRNYKEYMLKLNLVLSNTKRLLKTSVPKKNINTPLSRFILVGITCVAIDLLTYVILLSFGMSYSISKAFGFIFGTIFSYFANKIFTFKSDKSHQSFVMFMGLYISTLILNVGINKTMLFLLNGYRLAFIISFIISTSFSAAVNFIGLKYVVFKPRVD